MVVIDCWLDGYRPVDEESITHLGTGHHIVVAVIVMDKLAIKSQVQAVLDNVITQAHTRRKVIGHGIGAIVVEPGLTQHHPVVLKQITSLGLYTKVKSILAIIVQIQSCQGRSQVSLACLELRPNRQYGKQQD